MAIQPKKEIIMRTRESKEDIRVQKNPSGERIKDVNFEARRYAFVDQKPSRRLSHH